ncbi:MAG TPA: MarR family transcriptional regulator [Stenotrophomonas sp.]|nr:MarR family transcriptional regulator [Stenotrophomonas sp.]
MNSAAASSYTQPAIALEQLAALVRAQSWRGEGKPALPPTQAAVMRMLYAAPEGLRAGRMAAQLSLSPASLSDSLRALAAKGWLARSADVADRRASRWCVTPAGQALARQLAAPSVGAASLMQTLDADDLGALLRVTQLLVAQAQRRGLADGLRTCLGCGYFRPYASGQAGAPHWCDFTRQPFGDPQLRVDCAEQVAAPLPKSAASELRFRQRHPPPAD